MNSVAKAALISAVIFVGIVIAVIFLREPGKPLAGGSGVDQPAESAGVTSTPEVEPVAEYKPLPERNKVKLTVEVRDKSRSSKLRGSQVIVYEAREGDRRGREVWNSGKGGTGFFEVQLAAGIYRVDARCRRYKREERQLTLLEGTPQSLVFELERGNSISGRILAEDGSPIEGARVVALQDLSSPDDDLEAVLLKFIDIKDYTGKSAAEDISASDGSYQLDGLERIYYTVRAVAPKFSPNSAEQIPAPRDKVDIVLTPGVQFTGVVVDESGGPIAGATVRAYREIESKNVFDVIMAKARPAVDEVETDASGNFSFETLGAGVFNFYVTAPGFQAGDFQKIRVFEGVAPQRFAMQPGLTIRGIVKGPDEEPISGARVRATRMGANSGRQRVTRISFDDGSVVTGDDGSFALDTLEDGKYILLCWHDDYETSQRKDIRPGADEVVLRLAGGGRIRGKVVDAETGQPVAGARLNASDVADIPKNAVAQEDGTFLLAGLKVGNRPTHVTVTAKGYARIQEKIKVRENVEVEHEFKLVPTAVVKGRVVTTGGDPIANVRVAARRARQGASVDETLATTFTNASGSFTLTGVSAGVDTWVEAKKSEYLPGYSEAFAVEPLQNVDLPPVVLQLGGAIGGRVTGPDGQPVDGCVVKVVQEGETELTSNTLKYSSGTNARGEYILQGLPRGVVTLVVEPVHLLEKRIDGVEVREGERNELNIQLEQGNAVGGQVVDVRANPIGGASIVVRDFTHGVKTFRASTDDEGNFTVDGLPASEFVEVAVSHDDYGKFSDEKVSVGNRNLKVVLQGLASIKGVVVGADGASLPSFVVQPQVSANGTKVRKGLKAETYNGTDGVFEYRGLQEGVYTLQVRSKGYATTAVDGVRVGDGEVVDVGQIELSVGGVVFGTVVDAASQSPVAGARVRIAQGSSRFLRRDATGLGAGRGSSVQVTDANGNFSFSGLKGGQLTLQVSHRAYVSSSVSGVNPDVASTSQGIVIALETGGEITGTVVGSDGKPRRNMPVYLIGKTATDNQTAKTDRDGNFVFGGVAGGSYTVKAHKFGIPGESANEQAETSVELTRGASLNVMLTLR